MTRCCGAALLAVLWGALLEAGEQARVYLISVMDQLICLMRSSPRGAAAGTWCRRWTCATPTSGSPWHARCSDGELVHRGYGVGGVGGVFVGGVGGVGGCGLGGVCVGGGGPAGGGGGPARARGTGRRTAGCAGRRVAGSARTHARVPVSALQCAGAAHPASASPALPSAPCSIIYHAGPTNSGKTYNALQVGPLCCLHSVVRAAQLWKAFTYETWGAMCGQAPAPRTCKPPTMQRPQHSCWRLTPTTLIRWRLTPATLAPVPCPAGDARRQVGGVLWPAAPAGHGGVRHVQRRRALLQPGYGWVGVGGGGAPGLPHAARIAHPQVAQAPAACSTTVPTTQLECMSCVPSAVRAQARSGARSPARTTPHAQWRWSACRRVQGLRGGAGCHSAQVLQSGPGSRPGCGARVGTKAAASGGCGSCWSYPLPCAHLAPHLRQPKRPAISPICLALLAAARGRGSHRRGADDWGRQPVRRPANFVRITHPRPVPAACPSRCQRSPPHRGARVHSLHSLHSLPCKGCSPSPVGSRSSTRPLLSAACLLSSPLLCSEPLLCSVPAPQRLGLDACADGSASQRGAPLWRRLGCVQPINQ